MAIIACYLQGKSVLSIGTTALGPTVPASSSSTPIIIGVVVAVVAVVIGVSVALWLCRSKRQKKNTVTAVELSRSTATAGRTSAILHTENPLSESGRVGVRAANF